MSIPPPAFDSLMQEHGPFLRRLARALVGDEHRADDLVQDTWLAAHSASQGSGGAIREPRAWLAAVLRRRASSEYRKVSPKASSEQLEGRASESASQEEVALQLERERLLQEAVTRLEEPYRSTIFLRYHEGLKPREISARTGTPIKTVMSRLARGTTKLREDLEARFGDEDGSATWFSAMSALGYGAFGSPRIAPPAASGRLLPVAKGVAAAALVVAVGAAGWFAMTPGPSNPAKALGPAAEPFAGTLVAAAPGVAPMTTGPRALAPSHTTTTMAAASEESVTLTIHVKDPAGAPAPAETVYLFQEGWSGVPGDFKVAVSDADGIAQLTVPAGLNCMVGDAKGTNTVYLGEHRDSGPLVAGTTVAVELALQPPIVATGRVLDADGVIQPGAAIYSMAVDNSPPRWIQVATADAAGRFALEGGRSTKFQAVVPGRLPSLAVYLDSLPESASGERSVDLILGPVGSVLAGRVTDESGAPVVGAIVMAGPPGRISSGAMPDAMCRPSPVMTWTDAEGRYTYPAALPEGDQRVAVFKEGFATASLTQPMEAASETCDVVLELGRTVEGSVLNGNGEPMPKARVWLGSEGDVWSDHRFGLTHATVADGNGRFVLHAVPSGSHELRAETDYEQPLARGTLSVELPSEGEGPGPLDIVLSEGDVIAGRVIDEYGTPVPSLRIVAKNGAGNWYPRRVMTDADGVFRLTCLPALLPANAWLPKTWSIEVRGGSGRPAPLLASLEHIEPGTVDLEVTVTPPPATGATLIGRIVNPSGPIPVNATLFLTGAEDLDLRVGGSINVAFDPETGAFTEGPLAPGTYGLFLDTPDQGELASHAGIEITDAGTVDLGDLVIGSGGALALTIELELPEVIPVAALPQILNEQRLALDGFGRRVDLTRTETGWVTPNRIQAGEWTLRLIGGELMVLPPTPITLVEGETLDRTIEAIFGRPVQVWVTLDPAGDWARASVRFFDAQGAELGRNRPRPKSDLDGDDRLLFMPALPAGTIQIQLWIDGEATDVSTSVVVPEEMVPVADVLMDGR